MKIATLSTETRYRLILLVCVLFSLGGIVVSVFVTHDPLDGPRGGAIAIGLTLAFTVLKSNLAMKFYLKKQEARCKDASFDDPAKSDIDNIKGRFKDLETQFRAAIVDEEIVNRYLVCATAISTLVVVFGDILCQHLMMYFGIVSRFADRH